MRFKIKTEQKEECFNALKEFSKMFDEEYKNSITKIPNWLPLPPSLSAGPVMQEDGVDLVIPLNIPKVLALMMNKKKLIKNLDGFLKEKKVEFKDIKFQRD
jgi:hypothetical protein